MARYQKALGLPLLALPLVGAAQLSETTRDTRTGNLNNGYALALPEAASVQGSAFSLPGWVPGTLLLSGNSQPLAVPLKYDLYHQELRAKRPAGDSIIVPLAGVKEFTLAAGSPAPRFVCYPAASLPAEVRGGCGEVLYDGPAAQLLKYQYKTVEKHPAENGGYASTTTIAVLETQTRYYLRWAGGRYSSLKLKRASLEQALADQPAALAALRARKGSIGSEAELASAVAAIAPALVKN